MENCIVLLIFESTAFPVPVLRDFWILWTYVIGKFAHKIISVTFFSGTTEASFLIFGTEHQYGEMYSVTQFWICSMSTSCLTRLWIFKRKEVSRRHMSSLEDLLLSYYQPDFQSICRKLLNQKPLLIFNKFEMQWNKLLQ